MERQILENITIGKLMYSDACIVRRDGEKSIFVHGGAPGDLADVEITKEHANYLEAAIVDIKSPSPYRRKPASQLISETAAAPWMHLEYACQLEAKRDHIIDALVHIAHKPLEYALAVTQDIVQNEHEFHYRNKIELSTSYVTKSGRKQLSLGYFDRNYNLRALNKCILAHKAISKAPKSLQGALSFVEGNANMNLVRVGLRHSERTGDTELALWTLPGAFPHKMIAKVLPSALDVCSIVRIIVDKDTKRKVKKLEGVYGKSCWQERLSNKTFLVSAPSFFQVNTQGAERLINSVSDHLRCNKSMVLADLYAGTGTFGVALAPQVDCVVAIEAEKSAVRDLRRNASINHCDIEVIGGTTERELEGILPLDALIVDPPRSGLDKACPRLIAQTKVKRFAYVSCNPTTWARDLVRLEACGYKLQTVIPHDLFPQTYHVELVSIFTKE